MFFLYNIYDYHTSHIIFQTREGGWGNHTMVTVLIIDGNFDFKVYNNHC